MRQGQPIQFQTFRPHRSIDERLRPIVINLMIGCDGKLYQTQMILSCMQPLLEVSACALM
jgi:hypothetical protein